MWVDEDRPQRSAAMDALRTRRVAAGLSMADLATRLGLRIPEFSRLENGRDPETPALLARYEAALAALAAFDGEGGRGRERAGIDGTTTGRDVTRQRLRDGKAPDGDFIREYAVAILAWALDAERQRDAALAENARLRGLLCWIQDDAVMYSEDGRAEANRRIRAALAQGEGE